MNELPELTALDVSRAKEVAELGEPLDREMYRSAVSVVLGLAEKHDKVMKKSLPAIRLRLAEEAMPFFQGIIEVLEHFSGTVDQLEYRLRSLAEKSGYSLLFIRGEETNSTLDSTVTTEELTEKLGEHHLLFQRMPKDATTNPERFDVCIHPELIPRQNRFVMVIRTKRFQENVWRIPGGKTKRK